MSHNSVAVAFGDSSPLMAHRLGDPVIPQSVSGEKVVSNQYDRLSTSQVYGSPPFAKPLNETALHIEWLLLA
jgi:hypothetical protein